MEPIEGLTQNFFAVLPRKVSPSMEGYFGGWGPFKVWFDQIEESIDSMGQTFSYAAGALV